MINQINYNFEDRIKLGLEYLKNTDFSKIKNGNYEILENKVFVIVQDYQSKPINEGKFEAHRKYVDIQYIIEGEEKIGVSDLENCIPTTEYNNENDIIFLVLNESNKIKFINLNKNEYAIFTPNDAHMPSIASKQPCHVRKAVVKVIA